ncbi:Conserved_hypothetical protein [Hexamita inflata]|uniref:Uncharacterized protein n=1 Tax=Hexamita inflata TaxID=28002 RepID=A0AA86P7F2_9EUKA|nr:Conserved hypothetical protein [Hexamita inflata]
MINEQIRQLYSYKLELGQYGVQISNLQSIFESDYNQIVLQNVIEPISGNTLLNSEQIQLEQYQKYYSNNVVQQKVQLQEWQLMFRTQLSPDKFFVIEDSLTYLIDSSNTIISQKPNIIDFYSGSQVQVNNKSAQVLISASQFHTVFCQNKHYFQIIDTIYAIKDLDIEYIAKIPNFKLNSIQQLVNQIFSVEGKLFVLNQTNLYILQNNKLKYVMEFEAQNIFQSGKHITIQNQDKFFKMELNFQQTFIYEYSGEISRQEEYLYLHDDDGLYLSLTEQIIVAYPENKYTTELEFIQQNMQYKNQKYFGEWQLMNLIKPMHSNLYICFEDGQIHIIDQQMQIIDQIPINIQMYSGCQKHDIRRYYRQNYEANPCQPVISNGKLYLAESDQLYVLDNLQLKYVVNLPNGNQNSQIFSLKNDLFCKTDDILHILKNNQFEPTNEHLTPQSRVYQYFDIVLVNSYDSFILNEDFSRTEVDLNRDVVYFQGGVCIQRKYQNQYKYTNLLTLEQLIIEKPCCNLLNSQKLTQSGAQLNQLPNVIFSKDFDTKLFERYQEYMNKRQTPELTIEINKIIKYNFKIHFAHAQSIRDRQMDHYTTFSEISLKIRIQCQQIQQYINNQIQITKLMSNKADILFQCYSDQ